MNDSPTDRQPGSMRDVAAYDGNARGRLRVRLIDPLAVNQAGARTVSRAPSPGPVMTRDFASALGFALAPPVV